MKLFRLLILLAVVSPALAVDYPFLPNAGLIQQTGVDGLRRYDAGGLEDSYVIRINWSYTAGANAEIREDSSTDTVSSSYPSSGVYERLWWECPYGYIKLAQSGRPDDYITGVTAPSIVYVNSPFTPITAYYDFYYIFDGVGGTGVPPVDEVPVVVEHQFEWDVTVGEITDNGVSHDLYVGRIIVYDTNGDVAYSDFGHDYAPVFQNGFLSTTDPEALMDRIGVTLYTNSVYLDYVEGSFFQTTPNETGGFIWSADVTVSYGPWDIPDNEEGAEWDPINPTNPPPAEGIGSDPPTTPGGDTAPVVAENYELFRDAVESALDNRHLSQEELQEAHVNALVIQGLSVTNIQSAMENAIANQGLSVDGVTAGVALALDSKGLGANNLGNVIANRLGDELDERDLNAEAIGAAVADAIGTNSYSGIGDNGETPEAEGTNPLDGVGTNYLVEGFGQMDGMADGMVGFIDEVVLPIFPQGLTTVDSVNLSIAGTTVNIDWGQWPQYATVRAMFAWMIHVMFFMGIIFIIRRGIA